LRHRKCSWLFSVPWFQVPKSQAAPNARARSRCRSRESCGADAGDGVLAGATAWTTINLPPGRYELLCNIAGHYGAGMYAELDAIGNR